MALPGAGRRGYSERARAARPVRLESALFDPSPGKILVLALLAVVIFGPDQLPRVAAQAGRALRELRRMAEGATNDLREGLGPEFSDFDIADLNPRRLVTQHLLGP